MPKPAPKSKPAARFRPTSDLPKATLGKRRAQPFTYTPSLLEAVPFAPRGSGLSTWVTLACLRFSHLCPVTGQPDWAELTINYLPERLLVESKSLKEYLTSFRMHGDFHEDLCRIVAEDLVKLMAPRYLEVCGRFDSRGSVAIWPYVQHAASGDSEAQAVLQHRRLGYSPGCWGHRPEDVR